MFQQVLPPSSSSPRRVSSLFLQLRSRSLSSPTRFSLPRERTKLHTAMGMNPAVVRAALAVMGLCLAGYILGPPLYWHSLEVIAAFGHSSCTPCNCDCSSSDPILAIPSGDLSLTCLVSLCDLGFVSLHRSWN